MIWWMDVIVDVFDRRHINDAVAAYHVDVVVAHRIVVVDDGDIIYFLGQFLQVQLVQLQTPVVPHPQSLGMFVLCWVRIFIKKVIPFVLQP